MVVLESAEHAARRGVRVYAELAGAAWSCDAYHPTAPDPSAAYLVRAMAEALADAGLRPDQVGCVLPHATGTRLHDVAESLALREVFGDDRDRLPLFALKAMIGHNSSAAGVFACLTAALVLAQARIPANAAVRQDPECDVWLPQDTPTPLPRPAVLVNACALGGNNSSVVLARQGWSA